MAPWTAGTVIILFLLLVPPNAVQCKRTYFFIRVFPRVSMTKINEIFASRAGSVMQEKL